eukprot:CAMPEP_0113613012 /NCGR_PEP_ID=MMETSP0017_2-20120614/6414_1 /TAXON_ID=2856 /ORGANISM="Cylindrotheca closterium" /LENGTH=194 /DNA_ID=CAMNT_0000522101 /DNA_START=142 /DNA_END=726 /DNA_ORIENTATION=+ /assembly_acc=CAM_ASM_000147
MMREWENELTSYMIFKELEATGVLTEVIRLSMIPQSGDPPHPRSVMLRLFEDLQSSGFFLQNDFTASISRPMPKSPHPITNPPKHDILLGRGVTSHPGNVCFRKVVKQYTEEYDKAPRGQKRYLHSKIREDLNGRGIRFLYKREGKWFECIDSVAEKKIAHTLRKRGLLWKKEESQGDKVTVSSPLPSTVAASP